jgi:glycerophosphoryl diester phosphodiesterase
MLFHFDISIKIKCLILGFSFLILTIGCNTYDLPEIIDVKPPVTDGQPLSTNSKGKLEGIFKVLKGNEVFGDTVILKWNNLNNLSFFGENNGVYAITKGIKKDSTVYIYGFWRYALNSETGAVNIEINPNNGSTAILSNNPARIANLNVSGKYGLGNREPNRDLELEFVRPFSEKVLKDDFSILAHRAGGRTSDLLNISENTLEMIDFTENLGSTGIEIDVRLTKDNVPVLYHDADINIRLTQKNPLNGPITKYSFAEISNFVTLINGEKIPTLQAALDRIIDNTKLKVVWLDMKSVDNAMSIVIPIQQRMLQKAKQKNRDLAIYIGLPDEDNFNYFKAFPNHQNISSLCELSIEDALSINAKVWAPRWTLGLQQEEIKKLQSQNKKAFCWTLDNNAFIKKYINEGNFDGILTNYPTLVAYHHYLRK